MATNHKILNTLKSAATHVNNSVQATDDEDENLIEDGVWHTAADLEYALFLFNIIVEDDIDKSGWKPNPKFKTGEVEPPLIKVKELLHQAEQHMENQKVLDAYKKAYVARSHLLKLQKYYTKKKRKELKNRKKKRERIDFSSL